MNISQKGIDLIKQYEGVKLKPYNCPRGFATIGYGHLIAERPVSKLDIEQYKDFNAESAENLLKADLTRFERGVTKFIGEKKATQGQFDAMVSFAYNCGLGNFQNSSILKKFLIGDTKGSADTFLLWNKSGGKVLSGLTKRRTDERELFLS